MTMQLISINLGKEQLLAIKNKSSATGIFKQPEEQAVMIHRLGLAGDAVCDTRHHGGPDQAVYVYGADDYDWWAAELGQPLAPGTFGENLTIRELESAKFSVGDRLQIGPVVLEVTAPRIPCGTLAARMGDTRFVKRYREARRPGLYCRVIAEGEVERGMPVRWQPYAGQTVTVLEMFEHYYQRNPSTEETRRILAAPIAVRARADLEKLLEKLLPG
jgi:MOSC domain-containing protein YiiM